MRRTNYHNPKTGSTSRTRRTFVGTPEGLLARSVLRNQGRLRTQSIEHIMPSVTILRDDATISTGHIIILSEDEHAALRRQDATPPPQDHAGAWLSEALDELLDVDAEAEENGHEPPSKQAKKHAERILKSLSTRGEGWPAPSVYPTSDGEVAIFFRNESRRASVLILCASDGQGACFAFADGRGRRARYEDAGELPDAFAWEQLRKIR